MEENKKSETEDAQNLHPGKLGIGKIIFVGCLALLLLFFLFFERSSKLICNTCNSSKLEPKAILVCLQTAKVPFKEIRFPYSIVKRTHCRCKDCASLTVGVFDGLPVNNPVIMNLAFGKRLLSSR